jgi:hypothetical protein
MERRAGVRIASEGHTGGVDSVKNKVLQVVSQAHEKSRRYIHCLDAVQ